MRRLEPFGDHWIDFVAQRVPIFARPEDREPGRPVVVTIGSAPDSAGGFRPRRPCEDDPDAFMLSSSSPWSTAVVARVFDASWLLQVCTD